MTSGVIADYITPSDEILSETGEITADNLLDEVSLYNLYDDRDSPEQDAERILGITYPTETLTNIIGQTASKFDPESTVSDGAHIIGGEFGSGKSHIELVLYHLLSSPDLGERWLAENDIDATLPANARTAALQMLNLDSDYDRLHVAVGDYLGIDDWAEGDPPGVHEIRDALDDRPTAVFLDEFERWFGMKSRSEYRDDNLGFLQNLLEASGRDDTPLTVYVSLLFEEADVEDILPRTNPYRHDLSRRRDEKIRFLLHRLVGEVTDPEGLAALAKEYTDVYRNNDQIQLSDYQEMEDRIEEYYPFHPMALDTLMDKFSDQQGNQDARGLLDFLTEILADNFRSVDLVLTGNVDVFGYSGRFRFVDHELVSKYLNDYHRLGEATTDDQDGDKQFDPYVEELLNVVLLHSLSRGGEEGANKREMLMGTMRKGRNAHEIIQTFREDVYGHAWHVFRINGEYAFDTDENPAARIEKKAEDIHKNTAIHRVERLVTEDLFDGRNNVYILDPVNTEQEIPDSKGLVVVVSLSAMRSYDDEFDALAEQPDRQWVNNIVFVTPEKRSSIDTNTGIIELGRKVVAGELLRREEDVLPAGFDEIHEQNFQNLRDRVQDKFGTVHRPTERGLFPESLPLGDDTGFYDAVMEVMTSDRTQLQSEVERRVKEAGGGGIQYEFLLKDFLRDTGYTTLTDEDDLRDALNTLCRDGTVEVGSYYEQSVGSLGQDTTIRHGDYVESEEDDGTTDEDGGGLTPDTTGTGSSSGTESETTTGTGSVGVGTSTESTSGGTEVTEEPVSAERHPPMGAVETDNRPDLIDQLERDLELGWTVRELQLDVEGELSAADLSARGVDDDSLAGHTHLDETYTFDFPDGASRQEILSLLWELSVPEEASFSTVLQVVKDGE